MELSEEDNLLITKYFDREQTESERLRFEERLKESTDFANEILLRKSMLAAIKMEGDGELRSELKLKAKSFNIHSHSKRNFKWRYFAAAMVVLIVATYLVLPTENSLFEAYYYPLPEDQVTRNLPDNKNSYHHAMEQYSLGNYNEAIPLFHAADSETKRNEIALYLGNCYLSTDQPNKAIKYLTTAQQTESKSLKRHSSWFLALAYLKAHQREKAVDQLNFLTKNKGSHYKQSTELLEKLKWSFY